MKIVYMAHPVSGDVEANLKRAKKWIKWIEANHSNVAVVANWIIECEIWDDDDPAQRAAGLRRDLAIIKRCDELWMVGPRVSSGMAQERDQALQFGLRVRDLTRLELLEPPDESTGCMSDRTLDLEGV
jgi:hypothetical protein